jgi:hypothetical protein
MDFFVKSFSLFTKRADEILGFKPNYDFKVGVKETLKWYKASGLITINHFNDLPNKKSRGFNFSKSYLHSHGVNKVKKVL